MKEDLLIITEVDADEAKKPFEEYIKGIISQGYSEVHKYSNPLIGTLIAFKKNYAREKSKST